MPVRVVTDTSAGLPEHVARDLGITVLDLHMVGDEDDKSTSGLSSLELAAAYARQLERCLLYTSPSPRDRTRSRMPSSA